MSHFLNSSEKIVEFRISMIQLWHLFVYRAEYPSKETRHFRISFVWLAKKDFSVF